jgi:hypothetical protein
LSAGGSDPELDEAQLGLDRFTVRGADHTKCAGDIAYLTAAFMRQDESSNCTMRSSIPLGSSELRKPTRLSSTWRADRDNPATATRVNERKVR